MSIKQNFEKDINNALYHNQINDINEDKNNYELKVSILNIDSKFRNKIPQNIIDSDVKKTDNNPITVTKGSNLIKFHLDNHNFKVGDKIILKNVKNNKINLRDSIYLFVGFNYFILNIDNHGLVKETSTNVQVNIMINDKLDLNDRLIGNIPLNLIIGIRDIYVLDKNNDENISDNIISKLLNEFNIDRNTLSSNYLFIKLPFEYFNDNKLDNDIVFKELQVLEKIISIEYLNIGGIPLYYLNADFPINSINYQNSHEIIKVEDNYFYFNSTVVGLFNETSGDKNIYIGKIINSIEGYPNASNYIIDLKKSFTNVVRIELVTSEIPYIDFNIKENINNSNNNIYWKYLEDGDYIYSASIQEGNYTPNELISRLKDKMNTIERVSSTLKNKVYNIFDITFDSTSQEIKFFGFKKDNLPNSLTIIKDTTLGTNVLRLNIKHLNNFVNIGDNIVISGSNKIGDIPASIINTSHLVFEINKEIDTYSVIIQIDVDKDYDDINVSGSGGQNVKVQIPARVSFLLDKPNNIGAVLGFKNVGDKFSITDYKYITSNFDNYIQPILFDEIGNKNPSNSLINLNSINNYLLLYLNNFEGVFTNNDIDNAFSKILLMGNPGDIMFNTFVNSPLEFDNPINSIDQLKIKFLFSDGSEPDFRNFDHSFTLRIVEKISKPFNTRILENKSTYENSLIDIYNK